MSKFSLSRISLMLLLSFLLMLGAAFASLIVGAKAINWQELFASWGELTNTDYIILTQIRIPRTITAICIGGLLGLCGTILQGLFRNPLVEPYTLGISGGASLGVALAIILGVGGISVLTLPLFGFLGSLCTIFVVYLYSYRRSFFSVNRMLLVGVMISFIASSAVMFLMSITTQENLRNIIFWTMGSLSQNNQLLLSILIAGAVLGLSVSYLFSTPLNAFRLGEQKARQLGVNTQCTMQWLFLLTSLLTGICISVGGVIGFVGLLVPHMSRILVGLDYRYLLIASFLNGAFFLLICDLLARQLLYPNELPVGVITGMFGGILFIYMISRQGSRKAID